MSNTEPNNELIENDKITENIDDFRKLKVNPTRLIGGGGYGTEGYIQTPYTLYIQYGVNGETNYPAKIKVEYVDGRKVKIFKEVVVNNYNYKEFMKAQLKNEIEEKLNNLYIGSEDVLEGKYWLRKTEEGRYYGYYKVAPRGTIWTSIVYDNEQTARYYLEKAIKESSYYRKEIVGQTEIQVIENDSKKQEITNLVEVNLLDYMKESIGSLNLLQNQDETLYGPGTNLMPSISMYEGAKVDYDILEIMYDKLNSLGYDAFDILTDERTLKGFGKGFAESYVDLINIQQVLNIVNGAINGIYNGLDNAADWLWVGVFESIKEVKSLAGQDTYFEDEMLNRFYDEIYQNGEKYNKAVEEVSNFIKNLSEIGKVVSNIDRETGGEILGYTAGLGSQALAIAVITKNGPAVISAIKNSAGYIRIVQLIQKLIKAAKISKLSLEIKSLDSFEKIGLKYIELKGNVKLKIAELRTMLEIIRSQLLQRYGWQEALIDDLPVNYLKKLTEEIKDGISAEKERFLAMVGERRIKTKQEYSRLAKEYFVTLKTNEIVEEINNINTAEDLIALAEKYSYEDPLINGKAIFVKGDRDGATEIMGRFEELGWDYLRTDSGIIVYTSPGGRWRINLRDISSSEQDILDKGYKVEATMDVMEFIGNKKYSTEIKFILLK